MSEGAFERSEPGTGPSPIYPGLSFPAGVPPFQEIVDGGLLDSAYATSSRREIYPEDWLENPSEFPGNAAPPQPGQ